MKASAQTHNRFERDAGKYAAYLNTPEGRLRLDLALATLQESLPARPANHSLSALDLGCGTGATAVRLAQLGFHVTLLDSSPAMLDIAERVTLNAGVSDRMTLKHGDAAQVASLFHGRLFDVILCHNLLEYVDDPDEVLRGAACLMRDSSAILSVLVRNRAGEVFKASIQGGDLAAANDSLTAEWGQEALYGDRVRLFTSDNLRKMLQATSFRVIAERGVRIIVDYLPPQVSRNDEYERILELECKLGSRAEFAAAARYTHLLARSGSQ
jgi:S-adenosylmethionine-dependent methyltransferase